ncbi:HD domain-containing protein [Jannaschia sp. Os4]|uniref:HD domain-containing protein n=1 Tax=Jannaschia sp. Os4 TaxID=2807617 RepID=UPI0019394E58|nr:HD domain-containing protein [Jannaschia sp. Os4]MBM2576628.1 HD domain-containing protein [Jannaschia sp. Os4]
MAFVMEADRLKGVTRATLNADGARHENTAEHSWQVALAALVLPPPAGVDRDRVIRMLLIHDLVEIDAGDAPVFGDVPEGLAAKEDEAARRIFGMLPDGDAWLALWREFEANETADARYAKSLDRFLPPNLNLAAGGGSWADYGVTEGAFRAKVAPKIARGAPHLWARLEPRIVAFFRRS